VWETPAVEADMWNIPNAELEKKTVLLLIPSTGRHVVFTVWPRKVKVIESPSEGFELLLQ
jgi:hypothetical protein